MMNILKSKTFWLTVATFVFVLFVALLNLNRIYKSEVDVLIIPKSETAAANSEQIVENLGTLPLSLSFFNRMIKDNPSLVTEEVAELMPQKKKAYWKNKVEIRRDGESGIIKIILSDKNQFQSQNLAKQTSQNLIRSVSLFYDIKKDVDIRVIDDSLSVATSSQSKTILFLESLGGGFILVFLSFYISALLFKEGEEKNNFKFKTPAWYQKKPEEVESLILNEEIPEVSLKEKAWDFEEKNSRELGKKAVAPENLPVASEEPILKEKESASSTPKEKLKTKEKSPIIREATPEEVKERLNKLLSGKL